MASVEIVVPQGATVTVRFIEAKMDAVMVTTKRRRFLISDSTVRHITQSELRRITQTKEEGRL